MSRFQLGVVAESLGLPVRAVIEQVSAWGVRGIQVDAVGELAPSVLTDTGRRQFRTLLKSFNLELSALGCPLRRGLDSADDPQRRIDHLKTVLELAFDLGARKVVVPFPKVPTDPASERAQTLRDTLTAVGTAADRIGSELCLEVGLDSGEVLRDYLNSYEAFRLRVNFDPANFLMNGFDPLTAAVAVGDRIAHTHARDARTATLGGGPKEVPVGAGDIEWLAYIATLESLDYRGYLTIEREAVPTRVQDVATSVRFLRRFVPAAPAP